MPKITIKIIACGNSHYWYNKELKLKMKDRKKYIAITNGNEDNEFDSEDKGILVPGQGFIFFGDFKIVK